MRVGQGRAMRTRAGDMGEAAGDINHEAVAVFLAALADATPRAMTDDARRLAVLVRDAPSHPVLPVNPATLAEALRLLRLCLIKEL